jgi:hypothetical protein
MTAPTSLDDLHAEYAELELHHPDELSVDRRRSVQHYRTEIAILSGRPNPGDIPDRIANWVRNLLDLEAFIQREGRWPRENNRLYPDRLAHGERRLAAWVRAERRAAAALRRCEYQLRRLACVVGYRAHPLEDRWMAHLYRYRAFLITKHRVPSVRSPDAAERGLAAWAAKQRLLARRGALPDARKILLELLPIWTWGSRT